MSEAIDRATLRIAGFSGLNQYGAGMNADASCAAECENALTHQGVLSPMAACEPLDGELPCAIETLALLHRRWHADAHDVLVAAAGGQLYWRLANGRQWRQMGMPCGWTRKAYQSSTWSWVTYEINPEGTARDAPVDVLLMSNALDGMICIRGDTMEVSTVATPKKFGVIARHAERIWGGAILSDPDLLVYSAAFDPFNWSQNNDHPEEGAGDIMQPSWDGDSFSALKALGSQLIAFKKKRVWRILGSNPGEYVFSEQFGGGAPYAATVAVDGARILMLGENGIWQYDGESVAPYQQALAERVFERMNQSALSQACACMHRGVYYCALPLDDSPVNNAVLRYDPAEGTWLVRTGVTVESFLPAGDALYFTSAATPGRIWLWRETQGDTAQAMRWVSPWMDLGAVNVRKSGFVVYLSPCCDGEACLRVGIETENRVRMRRVVPGKQPRVRRLRFGVGGRRFRLIVESPPGPVWQLAGGVQLEMETDAD